MRTIISLGARICLFLECLRGLLKARTDVVIENIALRHQLAVLKQKRPSLELSSLDRMFWVLLRRFWPGWKNALVIVEPQTVIRWHRRGFSMYWRWISRRRKAPGRPLVEKEIRDLIRRMTMENPTWGAPRIHGELLKLGFNVCERTISRYLPRRPRNEDKVKKWIAFLRNHREAVAAMDFFTVPTAGFRVLYVLFILHHARRNVIHFNVTDHPTAHWVCQQIREAFPGADPVPEYLVFDRDSIFGKDVIHTIKAFGMKPVRTAYRAPWQNGVAERWVGSCRRELLDHVIPFSSCHLRRLIADYVAYHHDDRTHYSLGKDTPRRRPIEPRPGPDAALIAIPRVGGLHHRYSWKHAA